MLRTAACTLRRGGHVQKCVRSRATTTTTTKSPCSIATNPASIAPRTLVTSAQKRALKNEQISGKKSAAAAANATSSGTTASSPAAAAAKTSSSGGAASNPPSGGGGGSSALPIVALVAGAAGGAYYMDLIPKDLMDMIPGLGGGDGDKGAKEEAKKTEVKKEEAAATPAAAVVEKKEEKKEEKPAVVKKETKKAAKKEKSKDDASPVGNRVVSIEAPPTSGRTMAPPTPVEHVPGGSRVSVEKFSSIYSSKEEEAAAPPAEKETPAPTVPTASIAIEAQKELSTPSVSSSKIDVSLAMAHASMRASLDETFLKDLDSLSDGQLRVRIVQLASEMGERTKWEAVRLREFLAMKEKEVAERYLETMQKQRLEFEDLLARRLREQEGQLTTAANQTISAKEQQIESIVNATTQALQAEHEAELKSLEDRLQRELGAKYESEFGMNLAEAKAEFANDLEQKLAAIKELSERLSKNEQNLQISRNFESGSQRAHRVSAAALTLAEKMNTSKGAMEEFIALKAAAVENGVIASALEKVPSSIKTGVPTLPELQTSFENAYTVSRQAAYVPTGRSGLEGQFAGMLFAALSVPPSADAVLAPVSESGETTSEGKMSDLILSRAKRHVQLGDLQEAVSELDKLKGQSAFTIKDWKTAASDRIAVEKSLKVIKMECALMNKNMAG